MHIGQLTEVSYMIDASIVLCHFFDSIKIYLFVLPIDRRIMLKKDKLIHYQTKRLQWLPLIFVASVFYISPTSRCVI